MTERELAERCRGGDSEAWEAFVRRYAAPLEEAVRRSLARFGLRDESRVADAVQETFISVLSDDAALLKRYDWSAPLLHYLARTAVSRAIDQLRRDNKVPAAPLADDDARLCADLELAAGPESAESRAHVRSAIGRLTGRERLAVQLHYWDGLAPGEMAPMLRLQADSVRSLLARARSRLKDLLKGTTFLAP